MGFTNQQTKLGVAPHWQSVVFVGVVALEACAASSGEVENPKCNFC